MQQTPLESVRRFGTDGQSTTSHHRPTRGGLDWK